MNLLFLAWQFIYVWIVIYASVYVLKWLCPSKTYKHPSSTPITLLPITSHENRADDSDADADTKSGSLDEWTIGLFSVRFSTGRSNAFFRRIAAWAPSFWNIWFTVGVFAAMCIMIVGVIVILFAAWNILIGFKHVFMTPQPGKLGKRSMPEEDDQVFIPMIPGLTLPMSHIGYYLISLLFCGLCHEAGHAIASFVEHVPIDSAGVFITYIYPGAFVNIPDHTLQLISPWRRLKIVCAGVWHNLVLYAVTLVLLSGGLKMILLSLGWRSLEGAGGVSVVHVRPDSSLAPYLAPGTIIHQLDDTVLDRHLEDWNHFLLDNDKSPGFSNGFCASLIDVPHDLACCDVDDTFPFGRSDNPKLSCFQKTSSTSQDHLRYCLPTLQILTGSRIERCTSDMACSDRYACVIPYTPSKAGQLVRIYTRTPDWETGSDDGTTGQILVFEGELVDIWESVQVSVLQPRARFLPAALPHVTELLLRYISSFTTALALLNILPAFRLDGEFALEQSLAWTGVHHVDLSTVYTRRHARSIQRRVVKSTTALVGFVIFGSLALAVLPHH